MTKQIVITLNTNFFFILTSINKSKIKIRASKSELFKVYFGSDFANFNFSGSVTVRGQKIITVIRIPGLKGFTKL